MVEDKGKDKCEECEVSCLEELKKEYSKLQVNRGLPSFDDLNADFHIEKIAESETDFLVREVRKYVVDKLANYLRFVEGLLQPMNAPMFVFSVVKTLGSEEKKKLSELYKDLAKIEIKVVELDLQYDEDKEVKFVKDTFELWQKMKKDLLKIIGFIEDNWDNKIEVNGSEKGYFG